MMELSRLLHQVAGRIVVYELLVNLLGAKLDGVEFENLLAAVGSPSAVYKIDIDERETLEMFEFFDYGFGLSYSTRADAFKAIGCEYISGSKLRRIKPFPDAGPSGINHSDGTREVQNKLAVAPSASRKLKSYMRVTYTTGEHVVECLFDKKGQILNSFSVTTHDKKSRAEAHLEKLRKSADSKETTKSS